MAASLRNRSFTNLADKNDGVLGDDFVHGALETWKLKGKTSNGGKWDWKGKVKHSVKDGQLSGKLADEVKIQFPYDRYYFWLGTRSSGDVKLHVDLGNVTVGGKDVNLFTNVKTSNVFKNFNFRFGLNYFGEGYTVSQRVATQCGSGCSSLAWQLTNRLWARRNDVVYGLVTSLDNNLKLTQYDAIVGYEKDSTNVYLEHSSPSGDKIQVGTLDATVTYAKGDQNYGLDVAHNFINNKTKAAVAVSHKLNDSNATIKAKLGLTSRLLEVAYKRQINKQLNVTASGALDLTKGAKAVDLKSIIPIPFGVQFELNL